MNLLGLMRYPEASGPMALVKKSRTITERHHSFPSTQLFPLQRAQGPSNSTPHPILQLPDNSSSPQNPEADLQTEEPAACHQWSKPFPPLRHNIPILMVYSPKEP